MSVIIRLQNLPLSANAANIRTFFQGLKIPDGGVNIVGGEDGDAFIAFATDDDARKAMLLNNQSINGVYVRLLLSSKQEMQSIITEAQSRVLKRSNIIPPNIISNPQSQVEKRSYTLYNPQSKSQNDSFESNAAYKMRIIDYSSTTHSNNVREAYFHNDILTDEPPRPSEFSYKSKVPPQIHAPIHNKPVYHYENVDYNYGNSYENYPPPQHFEDNNNYDDGYGNENYEEPANDYGEYYDGNEQYYDNEQMNYRKSLLPTPPMEKPKKPQVGVPLNRYHDYTERPPWLEESIMVSQSCMVRVCLPLPAISEQTVLDVFKNIMIVPKRGIKIEIDCEQRPTGYVFVLFLNSFEAWKALKLNNKQYRGVSLSVESGIELDFSKVCDNADQCAAQLELPLPQRSPYYHDLCLEIINVSSEVTVKDVKNFLNISIDNKRVHFTERPDHQQCCLINVLDERMMMKVLSFNGAIFRFNSIRVIAISKYQFKSYMTMVGTGVGGAGAVVASVDVKREHTNSGSSGSVVPVANPQLAARKYLVDTTKNVLSCAKLENLPEDITVTDLAQLFTSTVIPLSHIIIQHTEAVVDFISAATCQKIINDLKSRPKISITATAITNNEFQSLKSQYVAGSNGRLGGSAVAPGTGTKLVSPNTAGKPVATGGNSTDKSRVKIKNLTPTVGNLQIKDLIRGFEFQPLGIQICYANGRHMGEAILTFMNAMEAVAFKDEFHGKVFLQRELEVLLSDRH